MKINLNTNKQKVKISAPSATTQLPKQPQPSVPPEPTYQPEPTPQIQPEHLQPIVPQIPIEPEEPLETIPSEPISQNEEEIPQKKGLFGRKKKIVQPKARKEKKKKINKSEENLTKAEIAYKHYIKRKIIAFSLFILTTVVLIGYGTYTTFFKHSTSVEEAAAFTNHYNNQNQAQQWDSGVQSFLQANLKSMLDKKFSNSGDIKSYSVTNISVERNQPYGANSFLTFFSADITAGKKTKRCFFNMFIGTKEGKFVAMSEPNLTPREPYTSNGEVAKENSFMDFPETEPNQKDSADFKVTLTNFFELGYNSKQNVTSIYKGKTVLNFTGRFKGIESCEVFNTPNKLGFNARAKYLIELPNGVQYNTTTYFKTEKDKSGNYIITQIL